MFFAFGTQNSVPGTLLATNEQSSGTLRCAPRSGAPADRAEQHLDGALRAEDGEDPEHPDAAVAHHDHRGDDEEERLAPEPFVALFFLFLI